MKYTFLATLSSVMALTLLTGCTGQMAAVELSADKKEKECATLDKKLVKVEQFIEETNTQSASHLDEIASAMLTPHITNSNNKPRMLKDANKRRSDLLNERQALQCAPLQNNTK